MDAAAIAAPAAAAAAGLSPCYPRPCQCRSW